MKLFRLIGNAVRITAYLILWLLYWPTRILGSIPALPVWIGGSVVLIIQEHNNAWIYAGIIPWGFFRSMSKIAKRPPPLVLFRAPPPPPAPPPSAITAKGQADDPDEATVIGRLNPKLRDLLHQKTDGAAS